MNSSPPPEPPPQPPPPLPPIPREFPGAEPEPAPDRVPAGDGHLGVPRSSVRPIDIVVGVLAAIVLLVVGQILVAIIDPTLTDPDLADSTGGKLALQFSVVFAFLAAAIGATAMANDAGAGEALRRLGLRRFNPGSAAVAALIGVGLYMASAILIQALFSPEQQDIAENLGASDDAPALVTVLAGIVIIAGAALGEELLFRGFIFGGLRQRLSLWPAAVISGLIFGSLHLTAGDLAVALQLSVFGVILAWLYDRTGSLWPAILLHGLNNALAFTLLITDRV